MKQFQMTDRLADTAADSIRHQGAEEAALESHLLALQEEFEGLTRLGGRSADIAELKLQMARTLVGLDRGDEAWPLAREALDAFMAVEAFESAADCCEVLFRTEQPDSLSALGQGIWLAVTYPIDPELSIELLSHIIDETPDDSDGAAVAATTALFLADVRSEGVQRENLTFFASQLLGDVARRHSGVDSQAAFDLWRDRLELREPEKFLVRLRNIVDVLVQDNWWFDPEALRARLPDAIGPTQ
ncbi:hypothetical protein F2Q65_06215 [Thiohalocapsa marina]|uniref:Uncharacterized protein n=1 Tax=Thiohalocapsa marina TaxID=424902 RepID=A0A5M8FPQ8_9GAMM|nr:hypothetical protein [Thiohalocapsa marina]KAA6185960.1 hypothetical protein F2Q65_06215 [Thiohalocapsa marina]